MTADSRPHPTPPDGRPADGTASSDASGAERWEGILVVVEQHDGEPRPVSWQLLGQARRLAARLPGCPVMALVMGHQVRHVAQQAIAYGADVVLLADHPALGVYRT
ncbi:MAG: hypothetical protein GX496_00965, partial [Firmicutes bacterium]|nr:hypothetical protein [Bacillota bacterium]